MIKPFLILIFISFALAGCIPKVTKDNSSKGTGEFVKGQVVGGFPNLPLYEGAKVVQTFRQAGSFGGSFIVDEHLKKVVDFYSKYLPAAGWEANLRQVSATNFVFDVKNTANIGTVIVNTAADGKQTAITMALEPR